MIRLSVARIRKGEKPMARICFPSAGSGFARRTGMRIFLLFSVHRTNTHEAVWAITVAAAAPAIFI